MHKGKAHIRSITGRELKWPSRVRCQLSQMIGAAFASDSESSVE
jgi:hypothetical protein